MRRLLLVLALVASAACGAKTGPQLQPAKPGARASGPVAARAAREVRYEQITVNSSAVGISASTLVGMQGCVGVVEDNNIRWRPDGTDPTSAVGTPLAAGGVLTLTNITDARLARFIATGSDAQLNVVCYPTAGDIAVGGGSADGSLLAVLASMATNIDTLVNAGTNEAINQNIHSVGGTPVVTSVLQCALISAASNNSTSCKASSGVLYGVWLLNTTGTLYYLRPYNTAVAPTCSSATGLWTGPPIPVPASTSGNGVVLHFPLPIAFDTGIGYCLTAGSATNDNTSAATGVFGGLLYK